MPSTSLQRTEKDVRDMSPQERLSLAERVSLPYSEVCCHMRIAGQERPVLRVGRIMAWVLNDDGSTFSFPIGTGEAGLR
jgi:hypothetical protein